MPTRTGLRSLLVAGITAVFARVFAVAEAYAIAVSVLAALLIAMVSVHLRPLRLEARRWVEPTTIHAGDRAHLFVEVVNRSRWRNPPVRWLNSAWIPPLKRNAPKVVTEIIDTSRRGQVSLAEGHILHEDPLGLVARTRVVAPPTQFMILPRIAEVAMPVAGAGILGELLMRNAQRLGLGEFDGLREYVDGDDPRSIHWRASARSPDLMVRQFTVEGARRCTVVFDRDALAAAIAGPDAFEAAVEIAATLVVAAEASGLTTRLVISGGADISGPSISDAAITALTLVQPGPAIQRLERDGSDGLGILILVTTAQEFTPARVRAITGDLALVPIRVIVSAPPSQSEGTAAPPETISSPQTDPVIRASDLDHFLRVWGSLTHNSSPSRRVPSS